MHASSETPEPPSPAKGPAAWAFFIDFDGTITDADGFDVLVRHFAGDAVWDAGERDLSEGRESLRDALARQTSYLRGSFDDVYALHAAKIRLDPTFGPFVERCEARGFPVTIVSSGIGPIIRRRLAAVGLERLPVVAPDVEARADGWRMHFADASHNGTDKARLIRAAHAAGAHTAFAGDGQSDFDAAVAADRRFAKRGSKLERFLRERNLPAETFSNFDEIAVGDAP